MSDGKPCVLIVDDDADTRKILSDWSVYQGYEAAVAADGQEALILAAMRPIDLALVDVWMPGPSGIKLATELKKLHPKIKVIIITAHGSIEDAAEAVRQGAFHYLAKPLRMNLLQNTVEEALAAQSTPTRGQEDLAIDLRERHVSLKGKLIALTVLEERVLACLIQHRGRVVSYDALWCQGWDYHSPTDKGLVQRAMSRLRKKLGDDWIVCVRGQGYRMR